MIKHGRPDHPVNELITKRWSPYGFSDRLVSPDDLKSLFEAARWAASSYNEQPWRYIVATRDDPAEFERILSCLVEANQAWAKSAAVLVLGVASQEFSRNGKPNRVANHDLGLAAGNLCLEATARGLHVHQMAGILPDEARKTFGVPDTFDVFTAIAIGYAADPETLPEDMKERDLAPRTRRPLPEFVFGGKWGESYSF